LDISLIWIFTSTCFATAIDTDEIKEQLEITIDIPTEVVTGKPFKATLSIKNKGLKSFAKFQQVLPAGMEAKPENVQNAQFTFEDQTMKLIWDKLPDTNYIITTYNIWVNSDMNGPYPIGGRFTYIENNEKHDTTLVNSVVHVIQYQDRPAPVSIAAKEGKLHSSNKIAFRIQIAASKNKLSLANLTYKHKIKYEINEEIHNKMYKYTIGEFHNFRDAKTELTNIKNTNKITDAFLTAYENGHRISINQAIKLTK
jgi:hypothetical protein